MKGKRTKEAGPKSQKWAMKSDTTVASHKVTISGSEKQQVWEYGGLEREVIPGITLIRNEGSDQITVQREGNHVKIPASLLRSALDTLEEMSA